MEKRKDRRKEGCWAEYCILCLKAEKENGITYGIERFKRMKRKRNQFICKFFCCKQFFSLFNQHLLCTEHLMLFPSHNSFVSFVICRLLPKPLQSLISHQHWRRDTIYVQFYDKNLSWKMFIPSGNFPHHLWYLWAILKFSRYKIYFQRYIFFLCFVTYNMRYSFFHASGRRS